MTFESSPLKMKPAYHENTAVGRNQGQSPHLEEIWFVFLIFFEIRRFFQLCMTARPTVSDLRRKTRFRSTTSTGANLFPIYMNANSGKISTCSTGGHNQGGMRPCRHMQGNVSKRTFKRNSLPVSVASWLRGQDPG